MVKAFALRLSTPLLIAASLAADETVVVRSGNGTLGGTDSAVHFLLGPPTGNFGHAFTQIDFSDVQSGPAAFIVSPNPLWISGLSADASAKWIGSNPNAGLGSGNTALYGISFEITSPFSSATLTLSYAADDGIGDTGGGGPNPGVYLNGTAICGNSFASGFTQEHVVSCDLGAPVLRVGTNWLYIEDGNAAGAAGLLFSATLTTTSTPPIGPRMVVTVPGTTMPWLYNSSGQNSSYQFGHNDGTNPVVVSSVDVLSFEPGNMLTLTYLSGTLSVGIGVPYTDADGDQSLVANNTEPGTAPSFYMNPSTYPINLGELVGTFTDDNGTIVGTPFPVGNGPKSLVIPVGASQLQVGVNDTIFSDNIGSWSIEVIGSPAASPPTITALVNAASFQSGPVSPGEIITISGTNLGPMSPASLTLDQQGKVSTSIGGVQVLFNDIPAPLIYVSSSQINAVVPYQIAGLVEPSVQVTFLGQLSNSFPLKAAATVPALFTLNSSGTGPGAILNQDDSANSPINPASKGSVVALFLTGEGQTAPAGVTGKITTLALTPPLTPQPLLPVTVMIGGQPANVVFCGEAPGLVSGILQVNVQIPATVPSGNLPILVSIGKNSSQSNVTLSVR